MKKKSAVLTYQRSAFRFRSRYYSQARLLKWINQIIFCENQRKQKPRNLSLDKLQGKQVSKLIDLISGVHLFYILDCILPTTVSRDKVTFDPQTQIDFARNWRNLQNQLKKAKARFEIPNSNKCFIQQPGKAIEFIQILNQIGQALFQGRHKQYEQYFAFRDCVSSKAKSSMLSKSKLENRKIHQFCYSKRSNQIFLNSTPQFILPSLQQKFPCQNIQKIQTKFLQDLSRFQTPQKNVKKHSQIYQLKVKTRSQTINQRQNQKQQTQSALQKAGPKNSAANSAFPMKSSQHQNTSKRDTFVELACELDRLCLNDPQQKFERIFPKKKREDIQQCSQQHSLIDFWELEQVKKIYSQRRIIACLQQDSMTKEEFLKLCGQRKLKLKIENGSESQQQIKQEAEVIEKKYIKEQLQNQNMASLFHPIQETQYSRKYHEDHMGLSLDQKILKGVQEKIQFFSQYNQIKKVQFFKQANFQFKKQGKDDTQHNKSLKLHFEASQHMPKLVGQKEQQMINRAKQSQKKVHFEENFDLQLNYLTQNLNQNKNKSQKVQKMQKKVVKNEMKTQQTKKQSRQVNENRPRYSSNQKYRTHFNVNCKKKTQVIKQIKQWQQQQKQIALKSKQTKNSQNRHIQRQRQLCQNQFRQNSDNKIHILDNERSLSKKSLSDIVNPLALNEKKRMLNKFITEKRDFQKALKRKKKLTQPQKEKLRQLIVQRSCAIFQLKNSIKESSQRSSLSSMSS